jgi:hypothetical protein
VPKNDSEDLRVGSSKKPGRLNLDEVAGAHPKSAPDFVLPAEASKTDEDEQKNSSGLSQFDKHCHLPW